jgi:hypothetical protein
MVQLLCWPLGADVGGVELDEGTRLIIDRNVAVLVSLVLLLCLIQNGGGLELS